MLSAMCLLINKGHIRKGPRTGAYVELCSSIIFNLLVKHVTALRASLPTEQLYHSVQRLLGVGCVVDNVVTVNRMHNKRFDDAREQHSHVTDALIRNSV